jgi:UDP-glucose 4-epimerase
MSGPVLITGGAGCIGSDLAARLLEDGANVIVVDNLSSGKEEHIEPFRELPNFRFVEGDLLDRGLLDSVMPGVEMVYHLAANPDVKFADGDPTDKDLQQNTLVTYNVLESMRVHGCRRLAFSSTSAIYGIAERLPIAEDHPCRPISLYGATKLSCEAMIGAFQNLFGIESWIFRFANVVGPKVRKRGRTVVGDFIDRLRQNPRRLKILGDGFQAKSYLLSQECVDAMLFAIRYASAGISSNRPQGDAAASGLGAHVEETAASRGLHIYNLGCTDSLQVRRIADMVVEAMGLRDVEYEFTGGEGGWPGDVPRFTLDVAAINRLGWRASHNSEQAVAIAIRSSLEPFRSQATCKP